MGNLFGKVFARLLRPTGVDRPQFIAKNTAFPASIPSGGTRQTLSFHCNNLPVSVSQRRLQSASLLTGKNPSEIRALQRQLLADLRQLQNEKREKKALVGQLQPQLNILRNGQRSFAQRKNVALKRVNASAVNQSAKTENHFSPKALNESVDIFNDWPSLSRVPATMKQNYQKLLGQIADKYPNNPSLQKKLVERLTGKMNQVANLYEKSSKEIHNLRGVKLETKQSLLTRLNFLFSVNSFNPQTLRRGINELNLNQYRH